MSTIHPTRHPNKRYSQEVFIRFKHLPARSAQGSTRRHRRSGDWRYRCVTSAGAESTWHRRYELSYERSSGPIQPVRGRQQSEQKPALQYLVHERSAVDFLSVGYEQRNDSAICTDCAEFLGRTRGWLTVAWPAAKSLGACRLSG